VVEWLLVQRDARDDATADEHGPAGEGRRAHGVVVTGKHRDHVRMAHQRRLECGAVAQLNLVGALDPHGGRRVVEAHERRPCRRRQLLVEPFQRRLLKLTMVDALAADRGHQRVEHQEPVCAHVQRLVQGAWSLAVQHPPSECLSAVVVSGPDQKRTRPHREQVAGPRILVGRLGRARPSVVGDVTGDDEDVGRRPHRVHVRKDASRALVRLRTAADVQVADVSDGEHASG